MALAPVLERLRGCRVVLASASPRRRDILAYTGLAFEATPSGFPEALRQADFRDPQDYAAATAAGKARDAARALGRPLVQPLVVIAADTVVAVDGRILEKPRDADDAERMLRRDKAGGYGIQGRGAMLVRRVDGDLLNAAGLPLLRLCRELAAMLPGPDPATPDLPATPATPGAGPTEQ